MKHFTLIIISAVISFGCAQEARYVDHEYGAAQNDAFDRQVVHKDYAYADKTTEGMSGIHAETIMETYHETFSESFSTESIDISATGGGGG